MFAAWYAEGAHGGDVTVQDGQTIRLGDYVLDGLCRITAAAISYKVDYKDAKGKSAARPTFHDLDRQQDKIEIECFVWLVEQKESHGKVALDLAPRRGASPQPVPIVSDQIADLDITHVQILRFSEWQPRGAGWVRKITCLPWAAEDKQPAADVQRRRPRTATKPIRNRQKEDAERRRNPAPASQRGAVAP